MEPQFNTLDLTSWPRGQMFYYFSKMAPTGYSICVDVDITLTRKALKAQGKKFFPAYLYLVTRLLNKQTEFKVAYQDETLGYWNTLTPLYATFHEDDKTISFLWTEFSDDFAEFYEQYIEDGEQYGNNHGVLARPGVPPANSYTVSCVPWISFKEFCVHSYDNKNYFFPSIEAGKFFENDGRIIMPLSITAHHATTDGYHINLFLEELQQEMNHPENWLK